MIHAHTILWSVDSDLAQKIRGIITENRWSYVDTVFTERGQNGYCYSTVLFEEPEPVGGYVQ